MTILPFPHVTGSRVRRIILEQSRRAHVGHIGSSLSVSDLLACLLGGVLDIPSPEDPDRDRLVMSKGHAALALYACLHLRDWLPREQLDSYCGDDSLLGVHPDHALRGVDFATGSLGQGPGFAVGAALAARMQGSRRRVFALLSDAECNEGSVWEAAQFAAHHGLGNLVFLIDLNGLQALGATREVLNLGDMMSHWQGFGWHATTIDGHDPDLLRTTLSGLNTALPGRPHVVIARTVLGKGVPFMENQVKWHYWPVSTEEYHQAVQALEGES